MLAEAGGGAGAGAAGGAGPGDCGALQLTRTGEQRWHSSWQVATLEGTDVFYFVGRAVETQAAVDSTGNGSMRLLRICLNHRY